MKRSGRTQSPASSSFRKNNKRKFGQSLRKGQEGKSKSKAFQLQNEEISSDEDEELLSDADDGKKNAGKSDDDESENESDMETADEKRRRLSKMYLEKMSKLDQLDESDEGKSGESDEDYDDDHPHNRWISEKLQQERLMKKGKFFQDFSESFSNINFSDGTHQHYSNGHHGAITCLALSNDEKSILSGSKDNSVILWDTETRQKTFLQPKWNNSFDYSSHEKEILTVAMSTDGRMLVSGGSDQKITVYDQRSKYSVVKTFDGHRGAVTGLAFQADSYSLFSSSNDRCLKYWDLNEMGYVETMFGHQDTVLAIDCWHKLKPLTASNDRTVRSWKVEVSSHLVFRGHKAPIDVVKMLTEESFVSGSQDGSICLWKDQKKTPVHVLHNAHGKDGVNARWIASLATVKASNLVGSGSNDGYVRLWSVKDDEIKPLAEISMGGYVNGLAITPRLIVAAESREPRLGRWTNMKKSKNRINVVRVPTEN